MQAAATGFVQAADEALYRRVIAAMPPRHLSAGIIHMTSALPFDDFRTLMQDLPDGDEAAANRVRTLFAKAEKPLGSLGRMEDIAAWLAKWSGRAPPAINRPLVAIFAGNHGVAAHGISPRPVEATARRSNFARRAALPINQICLAYDLGLKVFDLALHLPTGDITREAALDERGCAATMAYGMEAVAGGTDLLCLGDLGVGNSTVAAAIFGDALWRQRRRLGRARFRRRPSDDAPQGGGGGCGRRASRRPSRAIRSRCCAASADANSRRSPARSSPPARRRCRSSSTAMAAIAAACVLHAAEPGRLDHCLLAQRPIEPGLARAVEKLGLEPLLDLQLAHGEGVGAALAAGFVKAAALLSSGMAAAVRA